MAEHDRLVDFSLTEPGALFSGWEYLHCDVAAPPTSSPHLPETPLANDLLQDDCSGYSPLDKEREAWAEKIRLVDISWWKSTTRVLGCSYTSKLCTDQNPSQTWIDCKRGPPGICLWPGRGGRRTDPPPPAFACGCSPSGDSDTWTCPPTAADTAGTTALRSQPLVPPASMSHVGRSLPRFLMEILKSWNSKCSTHLRRTDQLIQSEGSQRKTGNWVSICFCLYWLRDISLLNSLHCNNFTTKSITL